MAIPESTIAEIKARVDIVGLVDSHVRLKKAGANHAACCPFHDEKSPSFTVSGPKGFYHCFGCGAHGDAIDFLVNHLGMPWMEAVARLGESVGIIVESDEDSARVKAKRHASATLDKAARWMRLQLDRTPAALAYVTQERKMTLQSIERFMVGFAPKVLADYQKAFSADEVDVLLKSGLVDKNEQGRMYPKFGGRIVFPIRDAAGWVIGFGARAPGEAMPKYMNSPDSDFFNKRRELFRAPDLRKEARQHGRVVVTEGYFDVAAMDMHGLGNACAVMGTAMTPENVESLFALAGAAIFCFDGDAAGKKAAWRSLEACLPSVGSGRVASFMFLPAEHDPDSFLREHGRDAFIKMLDGAAPLSQFLLDAYRAKKESEPLERHSELADQSARLVAKIRDDVLRNGLFVQLASLFGVPVNVMKRKGGLRVNEARAPSAAPEVREALEPVLLGNLVRRPWMVERLPPDVTLRLEGGNEIVAGLRLMDVREGDDIEGALQLYFGDSPLMSLIARLKEEEVDDDIPAMARRVELNWVGRRMSELDGRPISETGAELRALLARKAALLK